jgi:hypothetical protein
MSWLSSLIGDIPLVGHPINQIGKVLPSGGQLIGNAMLPGVGNIVGGAIDGNTTPLQKTIGTGVDAAAGGIGLAGLLGGGAATGAASGAATGATGAAAGAPTSLASLLANIPGIGGLLSGLVKGAGGASGLIDKGLGAAQLVNAANLQKQSTGYAKNAMDTANQSYDSRAPLRLAGVQGMLHPTPSSDVSGLSNIAAAGNPFAANRVGAPMPLRNA